MRIVALAAESESASPVAHAKQRRPIKAFVRGGAPIPFIELFRQVDGSASPTQLPIKRVIIGPHRDQLSRAEAVKRLLKSYGYNADVTCSEIPYIGR